MGMGRPVDAPRGEAALLDSEAVGKIAEEVAKEFTEEVANIPDNSEGWSEEEGVETSKKEAEVEVGRKSYELRWKEAKYGRYNDTRGDWVIMK